VTVFVVLLNIVLALVDALAIYFQETVELHHLALGDEFWVLGVG
jgi:hypothetical protein